MHNAINRGMRIRTMLNYMRGHYTLIYFHIHNICARVQCKYCAGVLCCNMLYTVQYTLNTIYIYIYSLYSQSILHIIYIYIYIYKF